MSRGVFGNKIKKGFCRFSIRNRNLLPRSMLVAWGWSAVGEGAPGYAQLSRLNGFLCRSHRSVRKRNCGILSGCQTPWILILKTRFCQRKPISAHYRDDVYTVICLVREKPGTDEQMW